MRLVTILAAVALLSASATGQQSTERRQFGVSAGPQHKMEMVGHEAVRQTSDRNALLRLAKDLKERPVICGSIKEPESADAANGTASL
jgi:hypothetical protein